MDAPEHTGQAARVPSGWYNVGLAHGVPGVIGFLGRACAAGIAPAVARPLLDSAVRWLLAQRRPFELAMRRPGGRLGGFHAVMRDDDGQPARRIAFRGLPQGAAGLGLALPAATTDVEPAWDRILLLS